MKLIILTALVAAASAGYVRQGVSLTSPTVIRRGAVLTSAPGIIGRSVVPVAPALTSVATLNPVVRGSFVRDNSHDYYTSAALNPAVRGAFVRGTSQDYYADTVPDYSTSYATKDALSGVNVESNEDRQGDLTKGSYTVDLPDGRTQVVDYSVDGDSGFQAKVTYIGEAVHPDTPIVRGGGYGSRGLVSNARGILPVVGTAGPSGRSVATYGY